MNSPHKHEPSGIAGAGKGHDMSPSSPALDLSRIAHDYADEIQSELIFAHARAGNPSPQ